MLALMAALHFPIMYAVMYVMVYSADEVYFNLNSFYMAALMVAPMVILMPLTMHHMYHDKKRNVLVYAISSALLIVFFLFTRQQTFVGDKEFLRSMIPHHSGAVLMCERSKIKDSEIMALCEEIIKGQKAEIEQMKRILDRL